MVKYSQNGKRVRKEATNFNGDCDICTLKEKYIARVFIKKELIKYQNNQNDEVL